MARKKVLLLASWYPAAASPINGIFVQDQARVLARAYDLAVLAPRWVGWKEILQGQLGPPSQFERDEEGFPVYRERVVSLVPRAPWLAYAKWLRAAQRSFTKLLAEWGKPDVIHAHVVLPAGWAAVQLAKPQAIPMVLTEHSGPFAVHLKTAAQRRRVKETLTRAHQIIAVSPALTREIQTFERTASVRVIGNLIKTDFFIPADQKPRPALTRFLAVALLVKIKGLSHLLHAARVLVQRGMTSFELTIGGDGPERQSLERLARALGLSGHCRFLGLLTPEQVRSWMQQSDALVLPSLLETFSIVLGEAMACGKPVIATRCGGPEFIVTPGTGVLVEPANAGALANAMQDFIQGRMKHDAHVIRQSVVVRFGEEAFLTNMAAVYESTW